MTPAMAKVFASDSEQTPEQEQQFAEIKVAGEALRVLDRIAHREGISRGEAVGEALSLKDWYGKVEKEGGRIMVERQGRIRSVKQG